MLRLQIKYLSFFFILVSILSFFNIIYSYYLNLYLNLDTYYYSFFISLVISILFYKIKLPYKKLEENSLLKLKNRKNIVTTTI